jgi:hypothetical protein
VLPALLPALAVPVRQIAYFAQRDRWFRAIVTDGEAVQGYGFMLPQSVTMIMKSRSRYGETVVTMA